jgi:hypothetical protein
MFMMAIGDGQIGALKRVRRRRAVHLVPVPDGMRDNHVAAFRCIEAAANEGRYIGRDELTAAIGTDNVGGSTQAWVCRLLERLGLIDTIRYQRGRQFIVLATGAITAPPRCTKLHWRTLRPQSVTAAPSPSTYREARKVAIYVDRTPCTYCGTRGDDHTAGCGCHRCRPIQAR